MEADIKLIEPEEWRGRLVKAALMSFMGGV